MELKEQSVVVSEEGPVQSAAEEKEEMEHLGDEVDNG